MHPQARILIVDDEEGIRLQLKWALNPDYQVSLASNVDEALEHVQQEQPNVVLLDIALSPTDETGGLRLLGEILKIDLTIKVIMITGHDTRENALQAVEQGACDFHSKPVDLDELRVVIKRAMHLQALERENQTLRLSTVSEQQTNLIEQSPQMREVIVMIQQVAATDVTVLILGESGTGKDVVAREIHRLSLDGADVDRSKRFVPVNCGAIPKELMESELFGHEKGAFTDAYRTKLGKFEEADGGTIFLDEIAELPLELQVKLLRCLQEREIERVGGLKPIPIDVRVIAATNQDIENAVEHGRFREDLYYRLNVVKILLPPLRDRDDDVILLANAFLNQYNSELEKRVKGFTPEAVEAMVNYPWPGNVRELQNRIRRGIVVAHEDRLTEADIGLALSNERPKTLQQAKDNLERQFTRNALVQNQGNISKAANVLGVTRATFYGLLKKHGIRTDPFRHKD
ncbi:MAG: PEP-CTERM-box response regulator transcription factor [Candidatus Poribacteria bacterium]|nr:PEP-CTERM-box response regulator transcription factor [Candidatus Poribacteria bacterium]